MFYNPNNLRVSVAAVEWKELQLPGRNYICYMVDFNSFVIAIFWSGVHQHFNVCILFLLSAVIWKAHTVFQLIKIIAPAFEFSSFFFNLSFCLHHFPDGLSKQLLFDRSICALYFDLKFQNEQFVKALSKWNSFVCLIQKKAVWRLLRVLLIYCQRSYL